MTCGGESNTCSARVIALRDEDDGDGEDDPCTRATQSAIYLSGAVLRTHFENKLTPLEVDMWRRWGTSNKISQIKFPGTSINRVIGLRPPYMCVCICIHVKTHTCARVHVSVLSKVHRCACTRDGTADDSPRNGRSSADLNVCAGTFSLRVKCFIYIYMCPNDCS